MLQGTVEHIRNYFHVSMAMGTEAAARCHFIFVDYQKRTEAAVPGVEIVCK